MQKVVISRPCYVIDNIVKLLLLERKIYMHGRRLVLLWLQAMLISTHSMFLDLP